MDPVVSVAWLADRIYDPNLVVLDATLPPVGVVPVVDVHASYVAAHLPGAVFFDIEALSDHATALPHMLPTPCDFAASLSALGVSDTNTLVIYEQVGVLSAPRAWWMLRTMGAREVYVLDGGLTAWRDAGHPTPSGEVIRPRATFHATLANDAVRSLPQVLQCLHAPSQESLGEQIVDARSAARFNGAAPEPRAGLRSGHMPGALSLPFTDLVTEGRLKSPDEARITFAAHGVDLARPITTTCGSGVTAAVLALQLERCAAANVRLYDGSWAEYAQQPGAEIASYNPR